MRPIVGKGRYFGRVDAADEDKAEDNHREGGVVTVVFLFEILVPEMWTCEVECLS